VQNSVFRRSLSVLSGVSVLALVAAMPRAAFADPVGGNGIYLSGANAVTLSTGAAVAATGGAAPTLNGLGQATGVTAANGYGVAAISTGGSASVTANASVSGGLGGGVLAQSGGAGGVTVTTGSVTSAAGRAIEADGAGGVVVVNAGALITGSGDAIYATNTGGDVTISDASGATSATGSGIRGRVYTSGNLAIGTALQRVGAVSGGDVGIRAVSDGSLSVYAGQVSGVTNGILASGGQAQTLNAQVTVDSNGAVTSVNQGRTGVQAYNFGLIGNSAVSLNLTGAVTANGLGVDAQNKNGDLTVTTAAVAGANNHDAWSIGLLANGGGDGVVSVTTNGAVSGGAGMVVGDDGLLTSDTVTVVANGAVSGLSGAAVSVTGHNGAVATTTVGQVGAIGGAGVFSSGSGAVSVTTNGVSSSGGTVPAQTAVGGVTGLTDANGFGIAATSTGGPVSVSANGSVSGGAAGGIAALSTGSGAVTVNANQVTTSGGRGIEADSAGGLVSISSGGPITGATGGIYALNTGAGGITINTTAAVVGLTSTGVRANTTGSGAVNLGSSAQRLADVTGGASGVVGTGGGDVSVFATNVTGATNGIIAQSVQPGANGAVVVDTTGAITGANGSGIGAYNNGTLAGNTITVNATGDITSAGGSGVDAEGSGGAVSVTSAAVTSNYGAGEYWDAVYVRGPSAVSATTNGVIHGTYNGVDIATTGTQASASVTVTTNAAVVADLSSGISAVGHNGVVTVNAVGDVTANGGDGVFASGDGAVNVTANMVNVTGGVAPALGGTGQATGVTGANGYGVAAISTGGPVNVTAYGPISGGVAGGILAQTGGTGGVTVTTGAVTASGGRAIEVDGAGGVVSIDASGPVTSVSDAIYAANTGGDVVINAPGGATSANGSGISGRIYGSGNLTIGSALQRVGAVSGGDVGIRAVSDGSLSVYAGEVSGVTNGILTSGGQGGAINAQVLVDADGAVSSINPGRTGVQAYNFGQIGNSGVTVNLTGAVTANGLGVDAETVNGDITVTTAAVTGGSNGDAYSTGVLVDGSGDSQISVTTNGEILGGSGVQVTGEGVQARDTVTVTTNGHVNGSAGAAVAVIGQTALISVNTVGAVTSNLGAGVFVSGEGAIEVTTNAVSANLGTAPATNGVGAVTGASKLNGFAVGVVSTGGPVSVTTQGLIQGGAAGGVLAQSIGTGAVTVNTAQVITQGGRGVEADGAGGLVTVNAGDTVTGATGGIYATNSGAGGITVNTAAAVVGLTSTGVRANTTGDGAVNLGSASQRLADVTGGASGVVGTGGGDVNVFATNVTGATNGIIAQSVQPGSHGAVVVDTTGAITGANGSAIGAYNNGTQPNDTITVNSTGALTSAGGSAIDAEGSGGDVTVTTGAVTANFGNGQYWDAVYVRGAGDSAVTVTTNGDVTGSYRGINAESAGTAARDTVTVNAYGAVTAGYPGQTAISAVSSGLGGVSVTTSAMGPVSAAGGVGIYAAATNGSGTSNVSVANAAQIGGAGAAQTVTGIQASVAAGNAGAISIASDTGAIYATGVGISAVNSGAGGVDIGASSGGISSAINTTGTGILASTQSGNIDITTAAGGTISPGAALGIDAHSVSGAITVNQAGDIGASGVGNTVGQGIHAVIDSGSGALTVHSTGRIYVTAGAGPLSSGIYAVNSGIGAVVVTSTGVIDPGAFGAYVQGAGPVSYTASGGAVEGDTGVFIQSTGAGAVTLVSTGGTPINGFNGAGVVAQGAGGAVNANLTGPVSGTTSGIIATSTGAGSTSVSTNGAVYGGTGPGIDITAGSGGLALSVNGNVSSSGGAAIDATSAAGGVITIGAGSHLTGLVSAANTGVINITSTSGSTTTLNVSSGASITAAAGSAFNVAVEATGGSLVVNNGGVISGQVDFSHLTGANTGSLNNAPGTVFQTGGTSLFNVGDDNFVNAGQIDTAGGLTTFDFLGGVNHVTNTGIIRVGFNPVAPSRFVILSASQFNNAGLLTMQNGLVGDSIVANGAVFTGSGASTLAIDANLGAPGATADTLTVASSAGVTKVAVHDTGAAFGAFNPTGVLVVSGATHPGDFVLDPASSAYSAAAFGGVLNKPGMFFYDLAVNGSGNTVLISAPKREAEQLTNLGATVQTVWYATAPTADSYADRRDTLHADGAGVAQTAVWATVLGAAADRTHNQTYADLNKTYDYNTSYRQNIGGLEFGADTGWRGDAAHLGAVQVGGSVAYVTSDTNFEGSSTQARLEGVAVSVHASFVKNFAFVDAGYTGDFLKAKVEAPALAGLTGSPKVTSNGVMLAAGVREPLAGGLMIEPSVGLTYVKSDIGDLMAGGETVHFNNAESLRASLGFRISGQFKGGDANWRASYSLSARAVDELRGDNTVLFSGQGASLTQRDRFDRGFAQIGGGLQVQGKGGYSGFIDAGWMFNNQYSAPSISLGGLYRF
jgi:hypothetical protein